MKNTSPFGLLGIAAVSVAVAFGTNAVAQPASEQDTDLSFVSAEGFEQVASSEMDDWFDESWYQSERFPGMSADSVFFPDAQMSPLERAVLLFDYLEGPLPHARYRVQMGTDFSSMGEVGQGPMAFIEVTRFNLGPMLHEDLQAQYDQVAELEEFGEGPHVAHRFVFTPIQGMNAHVVAAARKELDDTQADQQECLGQACMSLESIEVRDDDWEMIDRPAGLEAQEDADDTPSATADTAEGMNASAAEIVGQLALASIGSEYGEPVESVQAPDPYIEIVVSQDITGQVPVMEGVFHQGHLMDDSISDLWYRWIQIEGGDPQWERQLEFRRPMGH